MPFMRSPPKVQTSRRRLHNTAVLLKKRNILLAFWSFIYMTTAAWGPENFLKTCFKFKELNFTFTQWHDFLFNYIQKNNYCK